MSTEPISEPARPPEDNVLERIAVIDHRLNHLSTQLTTIDTLLEGLNEIFDKLEILIESSNSADQT